MPGFRYKAFISYSHTDEPWASWLHRELEAYQPPEDLELPGRLSPIFQDREELAASRDLSDAIEAALAASEFLIVVCSPAAASSKWVRAEVEKFIGFGREENVLCLIVEGKPHDARSECLPEPLRKREPLAADVRGDSSARSSALLRIVAGLLRVEFNRLRRREASIALLPFRDLSPAGDKDYLADGFAEELLNRLTRLRDLRVISRSSSFQFRDQALPATEIGRQLDATYVVEGSVRTMGKAIRVGVQLTDTRTDSIRWSMSYDRTLDDAFALQDEIAASVAAELHRTVRAQASARKAVNAQAYQLLLRARHLARQFKREALERSNELLQEALQLEPGYPDLWNGLADNYGTQAGEGFGDPEERIRLSREATEKVLALDPDNAVALSQRAWIALRFDNDLSAAAKDLQRALADGTHDARVLSTAAGLLTRMRRIEEGVAVARRVTKLDPLNSHAFANLGAFSLFAGRYDDAIHAYRHALEISPGFVGANFAIGLASLEKGDLEAAAASMQRESDEEFRTKGLAFLYWAQGNTDAFHAELKLLIETWGAVWPSEVSEVYAYAGMADEAFEWIDRATNLEQGAGWAECVLNPAYRKLRDDVRWPGLLEALHLAPAQLAQIRFNLPDVLQRPG
ncbi:MAG: TIR domain-containing protein [Pseudomonadales bacterium]